MAAPVHQADPHVDGHRAERGGDHRVGVHLGELRDLLSKAGYSQEHVLDTAVTSQGGAPR